MAQAWGIGLFANLVVTVAFLAVAGLLAANLTKSRQWRRNPLGVGTVLLYLTCGGGHAIHTLQLLEGARSAGSVAAAPVLAEYGSPHMWLADVLTAVAGVSYWAMRRRFPGLVTGAAVYEDLRVRQRQALEIHDNVVQGLVRARLALDLQSTTESERAVQETLEASKKIITDLLGREAVAPGQLRRGAAPRPALEEVGHGR